MASQQVGGHGQIGHEQGTTPHPAAATPTLQVKDGVAEEQVAQAVTAPLRLLRKCCEQGAMDCLLYTSPSPRDRQKSRMPSSA